MWSKMAEPEVTKLDLTFLRTYLTVVIAVRYTYFFLGILGLCLLQIDLVYCTHLRLLQNLLVRGELK